MKTSFFNKNFLFLLLWCNLTITFSDVLYFIKYAVLDVCVFVRTKHHGHLSVSYTTYFDKIFDHFSVFSFQGTKRLSLSKTTGLEKTRTSDLTLIRRAL